MVGGQGAMIILEAVRCAGLGQALGSSKADLVVLVVELEGEARACPSVVIRGVPRLETGHSQGTAASWCGVEDSATKGVSPRAWMAATGYCTGPWGAKSVGQSTKGSGVPPRLLRCLVLVIQAGR